MKKWIFVFAALFVLSCQHVERDIAGTKVGPKFGKKVIRNYFQSVPPEERADILGRAEVFTENFDVNSIAKANIIENVQQFCGAPYKFEKAHVQEQLRSSGDDFKQGQVFESYKWAPVECDYHADTDKSMSGGSIKFLCDFADTKSKEGKTTKKVRYADDTYSVLDSEVVETIIASNLAKLIGFPTKTFCPATIHCKGCPSSRPWKDERASKPAGRSTHRFEWALVEDAVEAYTVSTKYTGNAPLGVEWDEIKNVKAQNDAEKRRMLIEREAWILWVHFVQNTDNGGFNNRLSCLEAEETSNEAYQCKKSIVYTHDHGHSFYRHMNYRKWAGIPVFQKSVPNGGCRAGLTADNVPGRGQLKGLMLGPEISAEARDLLYDRLSRLTDQQWVDLFQLARGEEATSVRTSTWLNDIKKKLNQMKSAHCLPFAAGKSVLFN